MFNKLALRILLSFSLVFAFTTANAALITQDILFDTIYDNVDEFVKVGEITIDVDAIDVDGYVYEWESFSFYGYEVDAFDPAWDLFTGVINQDDMWLGLESLDFDVTLFDYYVFAGFIDVYWPEDSITYAFYDVNADLYDAGALAFGKASVVPEPTALFLFFTGLIGIALRRKQVN